MEYFLMSEKLKNAKKYEKSYGAESEIYVKDDILFKILLKMYRTKERQRVVEELSEVKNEQIVSPNFGLKDGRNSFCGIGFTFLKDYSTLLEFIKSNYLPLSERKKLCYIVTDIVELIHLLGFSFCDIHLNNFMINGSSVKAVDLDSSLLLKNLSSYVASVRRELSATFLSELCLSILFNTEIDLNPSNIEILLKISNEKEKKLIKSATYILGTESIDIKESIDSFDDDYIEANRRLLL